ncbi:hypothetical protein [Parasalinivibrio latis]|uniref:hypothetical protein n=1 Tax=Parasalinivibrio latis TaxID=2952610 RepID=UPI003DA217C0
MRHGFMNYPVIVSQINVGLVFGTMALLVIMLLTMRYVPDAGKSGAWTLFLGGGVSLPAQ